MRGGLWRDPWRCASESVAPSATQQTGQQRGLAESAQGTPLALASQHTPSSPLTADTMRHRSMPDDAETRQSTDNHRSAHRCLHPLLTWAAFPRRAAQCRGVQPSSRDATSSRAVLLDGTTLCPHANTSVPARYSAQGTPTPFEPPLSSMPVDACRCKVLFHRAPRHTVDLAQNPSSNSALHQKRPGQTGGCATAWRIQETGLHLQ